MSTAKQKANVKAWVKALRSGKFKQAKGVLKSDKGGYCCLGVLAETCGVAFAERTTTAPYDKKCVGYPLKSSKNFEVLPAKLFERLTGLDADQQGYLAEKNDLGVRFFNIAKSIEKLTTESK